jgi:hypothetical protein
MKIAGFYEIHGLEHQGGSKRFFQGIDEVDPLFCENAAMR